MCTSQETCTEALSRSSFDTHSLIQFVGELVEVHVVYPHHLRSPELLPKRRGVLLNSERHPLRSFRKRLDDGPIDGSKVPVLEAVSQEQQTAVLHHRRYQRGDSSVAFPSK